MTYERLKQAIGNLVDIERDAEQSLVIQPSDLARCAEASRDGLEAILEELQVLQPQLPGVESTEINAAQEPMQDPKLVIAVTIRVWPNEAKALTKLARMRRLSRSQVLRQALEAYARTALRFDEYRALYPIR